MHSHDRTRLRTLLAACSGIVCLALAGTALSAAPDQLDASVVGTLKVRHGDPTRFSTGNRLLSDGLRAASPFGGPIPGIDSLANFTGQYQTPGVDWAGNPTTTWSYAMVGRSPARGDTTAIRAPVIAVSLDLRDSAGNPRTAPNGQPLYSDATQFLKPVLNSPVFSPARFPGNEDPLQFADAVQRAEFYGTTGEEWHTVLKPVTGTARVMTIAQDPACGTTTNGVAGHCNYHWAANADGSCCFYILIDENVFAPLLIPPATADNTTVIGAAEIAGDIRTTDLASFLFPNTFLYQGTTTNCCVLGFHSFDYEPGLTATAAPRFYVFDYSSWITPGLFGAAFADVTALSHEVSETFNDPFVVFDGVTNETPWWLAPNGNCQDNLEVGDVVEGLPNATYPVRSHGSVYHPQNVALLQWFEFQSPSSAWGGAYTYPDATVITSLSAPQPLNCGQP